MLRSLVSCSTLFAVAAPSIQAATLFTEDFDYPDSSSLGAQPAWSQFGAGSPVIIEDGVASNGSSFNTGLRAVVPPSQPDTVYFSADMSLTDLSNGSGFFGLALGTSGGGASNGGGPNLEIGLSDNFYGTGYNIYGRVVNRSNTSLSSIAVAPYTAGSLVRLVARASEDASGTFTTLTIWNNPASEADTPIIEFTQFAAITFNAVRLGFFVGNTDNEQTIDNIRVASTFAEVVPEPSITLLGGFAGLLLLRRRR